MYANEGSTCPSLHTLTTHSHETASDRFFFFLFLSMFFTPMEPLEFVRCGGAVATSSMSSKDRKWILYTLHISPS